MIDDATIEARKPLWCALSNLWLDTELDEAELDRIARVMDESGLTIDELRDVYLREVAPAVYSNLCPFVVAGEWRPFDEQMLAARIVHLLRSRPRWLRFRAAFPWTRWTMTHATEQHWVVLVDRVRRARGTK